ncbi:MAG: amidohydrolase family protein [Planctomycetes bacterium]|nr:amidohydrolase family protein [Planctomycetota bacterium]
MTFHRKLLGGLLALLVLGQSGLLLAQERPRYALLAGKVLTMNDQDEVLDNVVVLVAGGKIEKIMRRADAQIPAGYEVVDYSDRWLMPGLIDPHNHTATDQRGDLHDYVWLTNPGLRAGDLIQVDTATNRMSIAGGVTTALLIPGSGTNMSGFGAVARLGAQRQEDAIIRSPGSIKIAQAGNPERWYFGSGRTYMNFNLRQTLEKARQYHEAWTAYEKGESKVRPEREALWEDFRKLFRGEIPASVHTQMFQVVSKSMTMLNDHFGLDLMIDHGTFDGFKAGELAAERELDVMVGPRVWFMDEQDGSIRSCAGGYWDRGCRKVGLNTDAGVLPQEDLRLQGAMSTRYGWQTYPALKGLTRRAAESLNLGDRIGAIIPGLDADLVVWSGNPLDFRSGVEAVYTLGEKVYDASERRRF